jgi:hypothetical protein
MAISSIILLMLTQMLSLNLQITNKIEKDNILFNQSTSITDTIQNNIFTLQAQKIELSDQSTDRRTIILITHEYDIIIDPISGVLGPNYDNPITDILIFDKDEQSITYNGVSLHSSHILIDEASSISILRLDEEACTADPTLTICNEGILKLDLTIIYQRDLEDIQTQIEPKQFVSTIII